MAKRITFGGSPKKATVKAKPATPRKRKPKSGGGGSGSSGGKGSYKPSNDPIPW